MAEKPGRIPAGELTAYERWELPNLQGNQSPVNRSTSASASSRSVKPLTAADIEEIRQQAYQAGFDEGKLAGHEAGRKEGLVIGQQEGRVEGVQQGLTEGQQQIDQRVVQLELLMSRLLDPIAEHQQIIEQAVLNIALAVSRSVIYRDLKQDSSSIQKAVADIFHSLPKLDRHLSIKLNPVDMEYVQLAIRQFNIEAELVSDPVISAGGCIVETSSQIINYTIEKRFQKTVHAMLMKASQGDTQHILPETDSIIEERSEYPVGILEEAESLSEADAMAGAEELTETGVPAETEDTGTTAQQEALEEDTHSPKDGESSKPDSKSKGADEAESEPDGLD